MSKAVDARLALWRDINRQLWRALLVGILTQALMRLALFAHLAPEDLAFWRTDVLAAFGMGLRFDAKHLAIALGPWLLVATALLALPSALMRGWRRLWPFWLGLVLLLSDLLSLVNHLYFTFYQSPLNALAFGFIEDDTGAVLATLWSDFPVLPLAFALAVLLGLQLWLVIRPWRRRGRPAWRWRHALVVVPLVLIGLTALGRGSLGTFPLRGMDMAVSDNSFVNRLVPSGSQALYLAWKERRAMRIDQDPLAGLRRLGLDTPLAAARALGWHAVEAPEAVDARLMTTTPTRPWLAANPPHVVVAVMEGWGSELLDFDAPGDNDLLGRLRPWIEERGDRFDRAISAGHGTHPSLEALLLDTPITPLTQSRFGYRTYSSSAVMPYREAGYRTVFLTSGSARWRDLENALPRQGFDEVIGESALRQRYPEAGGGTWGVDDAWMFRHADTLLEEADAAGRPLLLVMLSTSNHPPYRVPDDYRPAPLDVTRLGDELAVEPSLGTALLETYQYANDALGGFLDGLAESGRLDHTLVAATGDHNTRSILHYPDSRDLFDRYGVPILTVIPAAYRFGGTARTSEWVGHRDIFPTLWAHSLSGTRVPWGGRDLYAPSASPMALSYVNVGGGQGLMISEHGAAALEAGRLFRWEDGELVATDVPGAALAKQVRRARAMLGLADWRIRREALGAPPLAEPSLVGAGRSSSEGAAEEGG